MSRNIEDKLANLSTDEVLAWCVAPRGGNHMAARVLNQCALIYDNSIPTAQVELSKRGQFTLRVNTDFFRGLKVHGKKFVVKHEAYHLAAFHLFRYARLLDLCGNDKMRQALVAVHGLAVDAEVNDTYMRDDPDFKKVMDDTSPDAIKPITPAYLEMERNLTYEEYVAECILKIKEIHAKFRRSKKPGGVPMRGEGGDGSPDPSNGDGGSSGDNAKGKGKSTKSKGPGGTGRVDEDSDLSKQEQQIRRSLQEMAEKYEDLFKDLLDAQKDNGTVHQWAQDLADQAAKDPEGLKQLMDNAKTQAKEMVRQAVRDTERSRGLIPLGLKGMYKDLLEESVVPWTDLFKDWLSTNITNQLEESLATPNVALLNLEWCEPYPGMSYTTDFTVAWLSDTSGSMGDKEFLQAQAEINQILAVNKRVRVHHIQIDTAIHDETLVSHMDFEPQSRFGYGGTRLAAAIRRFMGDEPEAGDIGDNANLLDFPPTKHEVMIIYTDGYIEDMTEARAKFQGPVLWLLTTSNLPRGIDPHKDTVIRVPV